MHVTDGTVARYVQQSTINIRKQWVNVFGVVYWVLSRV